MNEWYDRTVARCDAALARQAAIMARLPPDTIAYALAEDTMAALRHTKTIFVLGQQRRTALMIRRLRFQVLHEYRLRGQFIAQASRRLKHADLIEVLEACGNDLEETWQCLELYRDWVDFRKAESWNYALGKQTPDNLDDAIAMLNQWRVSREVIH